MQRVGQRDSREIERDSLSWSLFKRDRATIEIIQSRSSVHFQWGRPSSIIYLTTCENLLIRQTNISVHRTPLSNGPPRVRGKRINRRPRFLPRNANIFTTVRFTKEAINKIVLLFFHSQPPKPPKPRINVPPGGAERISRGGFSRRYHAENWT